MKTKQTKKDNVLVQSEALIDYAEQNDLHFSTVLMTGAILMGFDLQHTCKSKAEFRRELASWQKAVSAYATDCFNEKKKKAVKS
jgi:hypothetical protein